MKIYYSIQDHGDGSASPLFVDNRKLAEWDQDHMDEGWGESCWGELDIISESAITVKQLYSTIGYYLWKELDGSWWGEKNKKEFEAEFLLGGVPRFQVLILHGDDGYYHVFVDGVRHYEERGWNRELSEFEISESGRLELQNKLDKLRVK